MAVWHEGNPWMPTSEVSPWLEHCAQIAMGMRGIRPGLKKPKYLKSLIVRQLEADGWYCHTHFFVPSRGSNDHYRGILDLITWPPPYPDPRGPEHKPNPHISNRPPPVLIEQDKTRVYLKTRAKLAAFAYPSSGRLVILSQANDSEAFEGIDLIVCLGANS